MLATKEMTVRISSRIASLSLMVLVATVGQVAADAKVRSIAVYPTDIALSTAVDRQRYTVQATREDGVTLDVTTRATVRAADTKIARVENGAVYPAANGTTELLIDYQGHATKASINVSDVSVAPAVSFKLDVMPVFMRVGCNTGSCHGAARGKDGFRLSLFGYDPDGDYHRLTREIGPRRINLAFPRESQLLEKAVAAVPHTGGKLFEPNSEYYNTIYQWLEAGAPQDEGAVPAVTHVDIYPPAAVIEGAGSKQSFVVRAHYEGGATRDVTHLAAFSTTNDASAAIDEHGVVTAASRGEAFVMARFDTHTVGSQVLVLPEDLQYTPPKIEGNYIDQLVGTKLRKLRIVPSEICTDEEFLRRASIDIAGSLPTGEEYHAFLADTSSDKREKLVDQLLARKEFSEIWAMKWSELLMVKSNNQVSYKAMFLYSSWLTDKIANNVPLNQMIRELLAASGGTFNSPATNYYQIERDTLKTAENTAQVFMGIRTQCAQCHNHPFDRWTMDDYYGFAAFFSQIGRKQGEDYREQIIYNRGGGEMQHPVDKRTMAPKYLGGDMADVKGRDRRAALAEWLTAADNPYFAPSVANRVWAHFFGIGIVDPVDDIRVSNPASNPELFATLGEKLVEYNYDFKRLVRDICTSQAYQRSCVSNESNKHDNRNFARASVRRIPAEMLLDCVSQATQTKDKFRGLPLGARAVQIADGQTSNYFLTTFGRSPRETVCACEAKSDPTLSQALNLINGATVQNKMQQGGVIRQALEAGKTPRQVIESLYVRCLTRKPSEEETKQLLRVVSSAPTPQEGLDDVFWAVLNSREFLFNH
jgi:hypothetical protein